MTPWLSVVMPTYNGERYVDAALDSIRRERADGLEVLVVDDGSTDRTCEIVRRYANELPLRLLPGPQAKNWVASTNVALRAASGRYACFLHQDDVWLPGRMAKLRRVVEERPLRLVLHPSLFIDVDGAAVGKWTCPLREPVTSSEEFVERLLVQNFIAIPSPVFDREAAIASGGLDDSLWYTADWDLWLRLGAMGPVGFVREALAGFRVHPESQTIARPADAHELLAQASTVLARHLPSLKAPRRVAGEVQRVAEFSAELNSELAALVRGANRFPFLRLARRFAGLGPSGWRRYLRDSRIVERVWSRLLVARRHRAQRGVPASGEPASDRQER